ncbi:hypothetical protein FOXB_08897 [Fusarium oxysporum f. sp. conglutinans Fo5176]|uniref:Uncharacterized protein n=1 Tax=Fusarium oxysporum (strain Fo5176) TaxID=660025 RepID=F9FR67_FUSOF|nr:hypothetical protein FOXB_08897 [Fusarium oxysporum f. sp. conglutinans Fo5176]
MNAHKVDIKLISSAVKVSGLFTTRTTVKARKLADISIGDNTGLELQSAWPRGIQRQRPTDLLKR